METENAGKRAYIHVTNARTDQTIVCGVDNLAETVLDTGWFDGRSQVDRDALYRLQENVLRFGARDIRCASAALGLRITGDAAGGAA